MYRERKSRTPAKTVTHFLISCIKENGAVPIAKQPPRQTHGSYFAVAESGRPSQTEPCVGLCKPPDTLKPDYSHTKSTDPAPLRRRSSRQYTGQGSFCSKMLEPNLTRLDICPADLLVNVSVTTCQNLSFIVVF